MKHAENCGFPCKPDCSCWCHKGCCLDVEVSEGEWITLKKLDNYRQAEKLVHDLNMAGINAMVSCACGSYEYGACELCNSEATV